MNVLRQGNKLYAHYVNYGMLRNIHSAPQLLDTKKDFYEVLRIPKEATQSEVKEAYFKLSKVYHPDVKKDESSLAMFRLITEAYDVLGHVLKRQEYDKKTYGRGEDYDTSKGAFYATLYKDKVQKMCRAPDYAAMFDKRRALEKYLAKEEAERHLEFKKGKEQTWQHQYDHLGEYGGQRFLLLTYFCFGIHYLWLWCEDVYGWGLP